MKQRITEEDLEVLNEDQKSKLRYLWIPQQYDLVCTKLCVNAETDEWENYIFVAGNVEVIGSTSYSVKHLYSSCNVLLEDITSMGADALQEEEEFLESELSTEETISAELRPSVFSIGDCLPLLTIGQLQELLVRNEKEQGFELKYLDGDYALTVGNSGFFDEKRNYYGQESCDLLWKALRELL